MNKGKLISVDGIDGAGKSTAVAVLQQELNNLLGVVDQEVRVVNILKDDPASAAIRAILTHPDTKLFPSSEACLYAAAVLNTYNMVIKPLLEQGIHVIVDRGPATALVYQGMTQLHVNNPHPMHILRTAYSAEGYIPLDYLLVLSADVDLGFERVRRRDSVLDRIESRGKEYMELVQQSFSIYAEQMSNAEFKTSVHAYCNDGTLEEMTGYLQTLAHSIALDITKDPMA